MGVMDWLRPWRSSDSGTGMATSWPVLDYLYDYADGKSADDLWREQPHLRTVIGFLTRNVAQLPLTAYKVKADGTRKRITSGKLNTVLAQPNPDQTLYEFLEALVGDIALYDNAYVTVLMVEKDGEAIPELRLVRPIWLQAVSGIGPYDVTHYVIKYPEDLASVTVPASKVIHFHGYNPVDARVGVSPISALKGTLSEQLHATKFRSQLWKRGGRVGSYLTRPADAPEWEPDSRKKFKRDFASAWSGDDGGKAGGVPIFEDGMEMKRVGFSAHDEEFVDAAKLALTTVAAAYYVNPTMVGLLDNANYSNVREFRRMLYGETLGPLLEQIGQRLTAFLLPHLGIPVDGRTLITFDTESRLRGTFEEQMKVAQSAVGGPVLTQNEFRGMLGLPPIEGGDVMVKPLNISKPGDQEPIPAADSDADPDADPDKDPDEEDDDAPEDNPDKPFGTGTGKNGKGRFHDWDPLTLKALEGLPT